jgi:hypothetical protein
MNFFTFLFLTVLVGCSIPLLKIWLDGRRARPVDDANAAGMQRQIDALQERVNVLEKIVTDEKYELRRELASLDDTP